MLGLLAGDLNGIFRDESALCAEARFGTNRSLVDDTGILTMITKFTGSDLHSMDENGPDDGEALPDGLGRPWQVHDHTRTA